MGQCNSDGTEASFGDLEYKNKRKQLYKHIFSQMEAYFIGEMT